MSGEPRAAGCTDAADGFERGCERDGSAARGSHQRHVGGIDTGMGRKEAERGKDVRNAGHE
jgi:hypothetical protein